MYQVGGSNFKSDVPLFYVPPPGDAPNVYAAWTAAYTAQKSPWANAVFNARLQAMDPAAKAKALTGLAAQEADYVEKMQAAQTKQYGADATIAAAAIRTFGTITASQNAAKAQQEHYMSSNPKPDVAESIELAVTGALQSQDPQAAALALQTARKLYTDNRNGMSAEGAVAYDTAAARAFSRAQDSNVTIGGQSVAGIARQQLSGIAPSEHTPAGFIGSPSPAALAAQFGPPGGKFSESASVSGRVPQGNVPDRATPAATEAQATWQAAADAIGGYLGAPPRQEGAQAPPPSGSRGGWDAAHDPFLQHLESLEGQVGREFDNPAVGRIGDPIWSRTIVGPRNLGGVAPADAAPAPGAPSLTTPQVEGLGEGSLARDWKDQVDPGKTPAPAKKPASKGFDSIPNGGPQAPVPQDSEPLVDPFGNSYGNLSDEVRRRAQAWDRLRKPKEA